MVGLAKASQVQARGRYLVVVMLGVKKTKKE
jgi:hypothetical protein